MKTGLMSHDHPTSGLLRWLYALKPASWPKLFVPALLGQALGASQEGGLAFQPFAWGLTFTAAGLGFIVLINDWGDRRVDAIKRSMFPHGCSPKTIPDRILDSRSVGTVGLLFAIATVLLATGAELALDRPGALAAGVACMGLFAGYTLPPVRLNYRGGGEALEMLGVGVALPLYNVYLQAGSIAPRVWPWVLGFAALSLASGVASGLSDEQSDRAGGKRTFASTRGNTMARRLTEACVLIGGGIWLAFAFAKPDWVPFWVAAPALAMLLWNFVAMRKLSDRAVTNAFREQAAYKRLLHRAIWHSSMMVAALLWLRTEAS